MQNLPDSQLHLESKTEPSVAKAPNYIGRWGDSAHTFLMGEEKNLYRWMGGWVEDSLRKYFDFVAPSCKLELAKFSALLRIQDGAEWGNILRALSNLSVFRL